MESTAAQSFRNKTGGSSCAKVESEREREKEKLHSRRREKLLYDECRSVHNRWMGGNDEKGREAS